MFVFLPPASNLSERSLGSSRLQKPFSAFLYRLSSVTGTEDEPQYQRQLSLLREHGGRNNWLTLREAGAQEVKVLQVLSVLGDRGQQIAADPDQRNTKTSLLSAKHHGKKLRPHHPRPDSVSRRRRGQLVTSATIVLEA